MAVMTTLLVVAWLGAGPDDPPSKLAADAASSAVERFAAPSKPPPPPPAPPRVAFEVREIRVASPEWRGSLLARLEPVARQEGAAVWAIDPQGLAELLKYCQGDARCEVVQAPRMLANVGEPTRMTNETAHKYVAHLRRGSDGPPGEGTHIAFVPEVDEVHDGLRVSVLSSRLRGPVLFARLVVEQNQVLSMLNATYSEKLRSKTPVKENADTGAVKASLLERLRPEHAGATALNSVVQVPEVISRRIEGEWLVPSEGALLVSMGPTTRRDKGLRSAYQERLVAITARPADPAAPAVTARATR